MFRLYFPSVIMNTVESHWVRRFNIHKFDFVLKQNKQTHRELITAMRTVLSSICWSSISVEASLRWRLGSSVPLTVWTYRVERDSRLRRDNFSYGTIFVRKLCMIEETVVISRVAVGISYIHTHTCIHCTFILCNWFKIFSRLIWTMCDILLQWLNFNCCLLCNFGI